MDLATQLFRVNRVTVVEPVAVGTAQVNVTPCSASRVNVITGDSANLTKEQRAIIANHSGPIGKLVV